MADVFISYDSDDRPKASLIAAKLMERKYSVWWDRQLIIGEDYYDRIEAELEASKAVIVVWSTNSVKSPWVKAEANRGARSNRLLPVVIEECTIPLRFEILQAADLRDWRGGAEHFEWNKLLNQVGVLVPAAPPPPTPGPSTSPSTFPSGAPGLSALLPKVAGRVVQFLGDPNGGGPMRLYAVLREFPEFASAKTEAELWFGLGSRDTLFKRLCEIEPRLTIWQNTGGAIYLRLRESREADLEPDLAAAPAAEPSAAPQETPAAKVEDVVGYAAQLLANSPIPIPLATVATAIEAEFGDAVRKSRWLGFKTLKGLLVQNGQAQKLQVGGKSGYLFDSSRHHTPTA